MITQEEIKINGRTFMHTYSDLYYIKQIETGREYSSAIDIPGKFRYIETNRPLPIKVPKEISEPIIDDSQQNAQKETVIEQ